MTGPEPFVHTGPFDAGVWVNGATVRFVDPYAFSVAASDIVAGQPLPEPAPVEGVINGPAQPAGDGWIVPVHVTREDRCVETYVDSRNVVGVILPEPYSPTRNTRPPRHRKATR